MLDKYLDKMKKDPFYRLSANVQDASKEEAADILDELYSMSDDDLTIVNTKNFY